MTRRSFVAFDSHGVDPLGDDAIDAIMSIREYTSHVVTGAEEANPQLIAYDYYGTVELYFIVLYYNGFGLNYELERDMRIKIPLNAAVQSALATKKAAKSVASVTSLEI